MEKWNYKMIIKRREFKMATQRETASLSKLLVLLLIGTVLCLCGCAKTLIGTQINEQNIPNIVIGKTTQTEVLRLFGSPYQIESQDKGQVLTYLYGEEFNWTVVFYSEKKLKADILRVYIDDAGVVKDYSFSKGGSVPDLYKRPSAPYY
jgi:outer membrane protein assembly factor BamE (lipoprotein component of BamABCDE complex)